MQKAPLSILLLFGTIILSYSVISCSKDKSVKGTVTVVDSAQNPVSGAIVQLSSNGYRGPGTIKASKSTDSQGNAYFNDFKLPAILYIYAYKEKTSGDTLVGTGILKLEEGKETTQIVTLK